MLRLWSGDLHLGALQRPMSLPEALTSVRKTASQHVDQARKNATRPSAPFQAVPVLHMTCAAVSLGRRCMLTAWQERGCMLYAVDDRCSTCICM